MGESVAFGRHNQDLMASRGRLLRGQTYRDCGTVCIVPTRGLIPARVVENWMGLMTPMNNRFYRLFVQGAEVGDAYNQAIGQVLGHPDLMKWPYVLTLEEDNIVPPDALLKLIESLESDKKLGAVGALYWTKGEAGQPMIYGDPRIMPKNFLPQVPQVDTLQRCNGLGMGATLFRTALFTDAKIPQPWFKTLQEYVPGQGGRSYTQDLYFFENAGKAGWQFACDTRVKAGHYDFAADMVW